MSGQHDMHNAGRRSSLKRLGALFAATAAAPWLGSCGGGGGGSAPAAPPVGPLRVTTLNSSLNNPWGLAFLPDGRMVVTEKPGSMRLLSASGATQAGVGGVPAVYFSGQGGLLDVVLDPAFGSNSLVYWTYSEPDGGDAGTAVARGRLSGTTLQDVTVIFRQTPKVGGDGHYGSRMAFRDDGTLFVTLGDRFLDDPANPTSDHAQNLQNYIGKIVRINPDGTFPSGNPNLGGLPGIWSYGHRSPQGAAIHPTTRELWMTEHGPQGGDELNRVVAGGNYGWPLRSYGCPYSQPGGSGCWVGGGTHAPQYREPATYWQPTSTAPSSLVFYSGDKFAAWQGNAFIGALVGTTLWRVALSGSTVTAREEIAEVAALGERIRCVRQGPDGWLYLLTDSGKLLRLEAA